MATYDELIAAARKADADGATDDARRLLEMAVSLRGQTGQQPQADKRAIATTPDGGTIWELPGGARAFSNASYSTNDPEKIEKLMKGAKPADVSRSGFNESIIAEHPFEARAVKAMEGVPGLGSYVDEAAGAIYGDQARDAVRMASKAMDQERPWQSAGLGLAGGIAATAPALAAIGPGMAANSLGGNMARGAAFGATEGAVRGFGRGEGGAENRFGTSAVDAGIGGTIGGLIPAVAHGLGAAWGGLRNWGAERAGVGRAADDLGVSPKAARLASDMIGMEDPQQMRAALQAAGPDAMLADAGPTMMGALDVAIQSPGEAARIARQRIGDRAEGSYYGVMDALRGGQQGPTMPPVAAERLATAQSRQVVNPAYRKAYEAAIDYASPEGRAIEELIERIPQKPLARAIESATDRMIFDGAPNPLLLASIGDDGAVKLRQLPNVMQLDYIKRAFDDIASAGKDPLTGQLTPDAAFASRIARDIREATASAAPAYKDALSSAATGIRRREAVRAGTELLRPQTTVEKAAEIIADATPAEAAAMREGLRGHFEHVMGNVRAVGSDQNVEARQAMQALRELSSHNAQAKMEALLGPEWPALKSQIDRAGAALGLRARVADNTLTFGRQQFNAAMDAAYEPGAIRKGEITTTAKDVWRRAMGATQSQIQNAKAADRAGLADLLTRPGAGPGLLQMFEDARAAHPIIPDRGRGLIDLLLGGGVGAAPTLGNELRKQLLPR